MLKKNKFSIRRVGGKGETEETCNAQMDFSLDPAQHKMRVQKTPKIKVNDLTCAVRA